MLKRSDTATQLVEQWLEDAADALFEMPETCALDVAERGEHTLEDLGALLGMSKQGAEQLVRDAGLAFHRQASALGLATQMREAVANDEEEVDWRMRMPAQSARLPGAE